MSTAPDDDRTTLEEAARDVVRALDPDARILGVLVPESPDAGSVEAARAVVALARATAEIRGRTILANLAAATEELDRRVGVTGTTGLTQVIRGRADLTATAVRPEGERFLYLPGGSRPMSDEGDARAGARGSSATSPISPEGASSGAGNPARGLLNALRFRKLAERVHGADGTLLLHLTPGVLDEATAGGREALDDTGGPDARPDRDTERAAVLDGIIRVGSCVVPPGLSTAELAHLPLRPSGPGDDATSGAGSPFSGVVMPPSPEDGTPSSGGEGPSASPGGWRTHRRTRRPPLLRIGGGAVLILGLLAGWWFLADGFLPGSGDAAQGSGSGTTAAIARGGPDDGGGSAEAWGARVERAPELPFSVLIASYGSFPGARERLDDWDAADTAVPLLAPTPVRGTLYYRLFAGARGDRASAEELMGRLVDAGEKERASRWDVRPVPLAFRLGIHTDRAAATAALRALRDDRIPAYLVPVAAGADTAWQIYAGAYDSSETAAPLREELRRAGREAELVTRRGVAR